MACSGQRLRLRRDRRVISLMASGSSSSAGRVMMRPAATMRSMIALPSSVRTTVRVQSANCPMPPVEMSACSAAKSGHWVQPSRVQAWHSLSGTSWYSPSWVQIWKTPLMLTFLMVARAMPYLASNSSSKMRSSKVLEQSSPMVTWIGLPTLPILRLHITGAAEVWQPMPTRASFSSPRSLASS